MVPPTPESWHRLDAWRTVSLRCGVRSNDALLEACRVAPDDDAPRLVWADAVGGERGELVVIQCELARGGLEPARAGGMRRRQRELLLEHGRAWSGLDDLGCHQYELRRGFVEAIELDARTFADRGEEIFARAPLLRSLTATGLTASSGDPLHDLRALLEAPSFRRLRGLGLVGVGIEPSEYRYSVNYEGRGDEAARLLAGSGALAHLDTLGISQSRLGPVGVDHLVASGGLAHLEKLWLDCYCLGYESIVDVLVQAPRVRSLSLQNATGLAPFARRLPPVNELELSRIVDDAIAALEHSRAAATLEVLRLWGRPLEHIDGFRVFPRLRMLDLSGTDLSGLERRADDLAAALPALRRLQVSTNTVDREIRVLAHALGPQLEELVLGTDGVLRDYSPGLLEELRSCVAGELVYNTRTGPALL